MKFDKSKVYTAANADELKIGSKVIVADTIKRLKECVNFNATAVLLCDISNDDELYRFSVDNIAYALAYLVEEPKELKWTDLKIGDVIHCGEVTAMVTAIDLAEGESHIFAGDVWLDNSDIGYWEKVNE